MNKPRQQKQLSQQSMGQHFLRSPKLAKRIVKMAQVTKRDCVFDLGAGKGALTFPLMQQAGEVIAVEQDPVYAEKLKKQLNKVSHVSVLEQDMLQLRFPKKPFVAVSNIPYSITTPIFRRLFEQQRSFQRGVFLIEKGAAKRFIADPTDRPQILAWRAVFQFRLLEIVPPELFSPPPTVQSAILEVKRREKPLVPYRELRRFVIFTQTFMRTPMIPLHVALKGIFTPTQIKHLCRSQQLDRDQPIRSLKADEWMAVFQTMLQFVPRYRWPR